MATVLSIHAGSKHIAYTVFWASCSDIHQIGRCSVTQHDSSYLKSIMTFNKVYVIQGCSAVVTAQRPGHTSKLEASLQAMYIGMDLPVVMMSETCRLAQHGLLLSSKSTKKLQDLNTAAVRQSASGNLGAAQKNTLSKHKAKLLTQNYLHNTMQAGRLPQIQQQL